ncbi:MAG: hypothetical protein KJ767_02165 [Nanoarchaeota archaeon]|nr:hypothetical protein [Nanoarchaeota archaeon]
MVLENILKKARPYLITCALSILPQVTLSQISYSASQDSISISTSIKQETETSSSQQTIESRVQEQESQTQEQIPKKINVNYTSLVDSLNTIDYKNDSTKARFVLSMNNLKKYDLESLINEYCDKFGVKEEDAIPFFIIESNMNPNVRTNGGCAGIGQTSRAAVSSVNKFYGTKFVYKGSKKDQVGAAVGYFAKTLICLAAEHPEIKKEDLLKLSYFYYNAGGAPVNLAIKRMQRNGKEITWDNIEQELSTQLLRDSASLYRGMGNGALKQKIYIIKEYIKNSEIYKDYLNQLSGRSSVSEKPEIYF